MLRSCLKIKIKIRKMRKRWRRRKEEERGGRRKRKRREEEEKKRITREIIRIFHELNKKLFNCVSGTI